jgi:ribosome-associated toxin RatA of RatAB toxin-antitoxin module
MTRISHSASVPYTTREMYDIVIDVEAYPQFVPWCVGAEIHEREADRMRATLALGKGRIRQHLTTENTMKAGEFVDMKLVRGPFCNLGGRWRFESRDSAGCIVSLEMEFEFSSRALAASFGRIFHQIADSLVEAFRKRAVQCYGPR